MLSDYTTEELIAELQRRQTEARQLANRIQRVLDGEEEIEPSEAVMMSIEDLHKLGAIPNRAYSRCKEVDIEMAYELVVVKQSDILKWKQFGEGSMNELDKGLQKFGLHLEMSEEELEALAS